jgi:osmotically-inducible protein OsmY
MDREAPHYVAARIKRKLAEDERVGELGIHVDVRGEEAFLRGQVNSQERRRQIAEVAQEGEPGLHFHNEINVVEMRDATEEERFA